MGVKPSALAIRSALRVFWVLVPTSEASSSIMAKICQVSGKKGNHAKHIRHRHSGAWKFRAPKKNRMQLPNLQTVTVRTPHGKVKMIVSTTVLRSTIFNSVLCGIRPIPKAWLKKPNYNL